MRFQVLIFDADGTLFDFEQAESEALAAMLQEFNIAPSSSLFTDYFAENKKAWAKLEQGIITQDELKIKRFEGFIHTANLKQNANALAQSYMKHLANQSILFPKALSVIKQLSSTYVVTILTNGLKEVQHKRIRQSILAPYVKDVVISDELGITKPNPKIIEHALQNIHHSTIDDVMIIGDSLTSDIQAGINASITTVWYNPKQKPNHTSIKPDYEIVKLDDLFAILK